VPALQEAVEQLAAAPQEQRLLVLVTDGNVETAELGAITDRIEAAGIEVIALAIGADADTASLARLTRHHDGRLLRVDAVAELPALMRRELDQRRALLQTGTFRPEVVTALPFLPSTTAWPTVPHYWVTRVREGATLHLQVQGDPLLVSHFAGAGRVAALTTRLDDWHDFWQQWEPAGDVAGGLPDWLDARRGAAGLHLELMHSEGITRLRLETDPQEPLQDGRVRIEGPGLQAQELVLEAQSPGRYEVVPATPLAGRYQALVQIGERRLSHAWLHQDEREFQPRADAAARLRSWQDEGLLRSWPHSLPRGTTAAPAGMLRTPLLVLVLCAYLSLLVAERRPDLLSGFRNTLFKLGRAAGSMPVLARGRPS
jgi:hypothetical protein